MHDWLLVSTPHLTLDMYFAASEAVLYADSQIAVLKCAHCQNLHIDTTLTTITSKCICKCSVCSKNWYESQVVSGNALALLGEKVVQK